MKDHQKIIAAADLSVFLNCAVSAAQIEKIESILRNVTSDDIDWDRINNDSNGNPRWVCHFLSLLTDEEKENCNVDRYAIAIKRAKKIGGKKYHNKSYGGGIVFQTYDPVNELDPLIKDLKK